MMIPAVFLYTQYLMVKKKTIIALKKKKVLQMQYMFTMMKFKNTRGKKKNLIVFI